MRLIRPTCIDDTNFVSSNVPADTTAEWSKLTSYTGSGEIVRVEDTHHLYESTGASLDVYPPDNVESETPVWLDLGATNRWQMFDDIVGSATENTKGDATGATTDAAGYSIGDTVINLASAGTGAIKDSDVITFNGDTTQYLLESGDTDVSDGGTITLAAPGLVAAIPAATTAITIVATSIKVVVAPGRVNSIGLLEMEAQRINIVVQDEPGGEIVYEKTETLNLPVSTSWYEYFYEEITIRTDIVFTDLPAYSDAVITVTLVGASPVRCGLFIVGMFQLLGITQWGLGSGIIDYSQKELNQFGGYSIVKRSFSKRMESNIYVNNGKVDKTQKVLAEYRSTPVLWVGSENYEVSIIYGPYKDFSIILTDPSGSYCSLTVEGLI